MNILILSCGTRNKIIQYFKKTIADGKIIATDMSEFAPALYEADKYYIVPKVTTEGYIDVIFDICKKESVDGVLSLIDPELSILAKNKARFDELGISIIGSNYDLCERSLNKYEMYKWLSKNGYKCAKSYLDKNEFYMDVEKGIINYPVFVKPSCGSASASISKVYDMETIEFLFKHNNDMMIQEYIGGVEIGADVYIDMISKKVVSVFTKKKLVMRAGETDKSVSFKDDKLFSLIKKFVEDFGYVGQIDIDLFDVNGEYYISEVNPRFGGGYPHAYECGCDHVRLIVNNLNNIVNESRIGEYDEGMYMMKFNEIIARKI